MHLHRFLWLAVLIGILPTGSLRTEEKTWTTSGFLDFSDGSLADGGVNTYVAANGTIRLFNLWDLNHDGNFDLPVACPQDHDGYVDLFFPSYLAGHHRDHPGTVYWNGPDGFDAKRKTLFPMFSGCGTLAADCNLDGHQDLIIANHTRVGNHRSDVWVYWGSAEGYSADQRTSLPATGPHYFSQIDIGNIYDRSDRYDYISPPFDSGGKTQWKRISWQADTPHRTRVEFQIRIAPTRNELTTTKWQGPAGPETYYRTSAAELSRAGPQRWIQYKTSLISPNSANTPLLRSVSIDYE